MKHKISRHLSWKERNREAIEYFVSGLGEVIDDPINRGYCALLACIINGRLTADDALRELGCLKGGGVIDR